MKKNKFFTILIFIVLIVFIITLLFPSLLVFGEINLGSKNQSETNSITEDNKDELTNQSNSRDNMAKYYTVSSGGNVDIGVIFNTPLNKDTKQLEFEVMLNTHSVNLEEYRKLEEFTELQVDDHIIITEDFRWESEGDSHHLSGILTIKNEYEGQPIINENTETLKLIFKSIAGTKVREHVYTGETLGN